MSTSDARASADTGVASVCGTWSCVQEPKFNSLIFGAVSSVRALGTSLSTFSGLKGNRPALANPACMFLGVSASSLAGLCR